MKQLIAIVFAIVSGSLFVACNQTASSNKADEVSEPNSIETSISSKGQSAVEDDVSQKNIFQIAKSSADHSTLAAAITAAELEDVLSNAGPLTVFAPNNEAFEKLPEGTVETLLKPENKPKLAHIIKYHAAPGNYKGNMIKRVMGIGQATGEKVEVEIKDGITYVNGAKILASIEASNGVIHVINQVLLPPEK